MSEYRRSRSGSRERRNQKSVESGKRKVGGKSRNREHVVSERDERGKAENVDNVEEGGRGSGRRRPQNPKTGEPSSKLSKTTNPKLIKSSSKMNETKANSKVFFYMFVF